MPNRLQAGTGRGQPAVHQVFERHKEIWLRQGDTLAALGRYPESLYAYDRAHSLDRNYRPAQENRTLILKLHGQYLLVSPVNENMVWITRGNRHPSTNAGLTPPENC